MGVVDGSGDTVLFTAAEVVDEEIAGQGGQPGLKAAFLDVKAPEVAVGLEEDVLGEVFSVGCGAGEAIADSVNAAVLLGDEALPGSGVTGDALPHRENGGFAGGDLLVCQHLRTCGENLAAQTGA